MSCAVVIGAGPAGLMAAEMLADAGVEVLLADAMPTAGRKLLMAGKSGLNLTTDEPFDRFLASYGSAADWLQPSLSGFDNLAVQHWATGLGQEVFTGSSGRVFPKSMKASPLLRQWLARLTDKGVQLKTRWRWQGWQDGRLDFSTPEGRKTLPADATVLALGGASWARLGSTGKWAELLVRQGIAIAPFQPSNMGLRVDWSPHMDRHFGAALKNVTLTCGDKSRRGEFVIGKTGLEGSLIYNFSPEFRAGLPLTLDLLPDLSLAQISERLARVPRKNTLSNALRKALSLDPAQIALLMEFARPPQPMGALPSAIKGLKLTYGGVAPIDQAISVAGGVPAKAISADLMLHRLPGVFCAGEMLDWEAPTGGYLLTACLATGRHAGLGAVKYLSKNS